MMLPSGIANRCSCYRLQRYYLDAFLPLFLIPTSNKVIRRKSLVELV